MEMHPKLRCRILCDAVEGERVAVFSLSDEACQSLFNEVLTDIPPEVVPTRTIKLNGAPRLHFAGGGSIEFHPLRSLSRVRGTGSDWVYFPFGSSPEALDEVVASFAGRESTVLLCY